MPTQVEVHKSVQVLLDAARKLPDVECLKCSRYGTMRDPQKPLGAIWSEVLCTSCHGKRGLPHPLRVAIEQAVLQPKLRTHWGVFPEGDRLRDFSESDPTEAFAWCGRLQPIINWLSDYDPKLDQHGLEDWQVEGNILAALDAARRAVEEVARKEVTPHG